MGMRVKRRSAVLVIASAVFAFCGLFVSRLNPFMNAGANNRLESVCSANSNQSWTYDRAAWTPVLWSCTVIDMSGDEHRFTAF
jgi:hypothetical protein